MRHVRWAPVHLWLQEFRGSADDDVPVRGGLQLRRDVQLRRLPARTRARRGDPLTTACPSSRPKVRHVRGRRLAGVPVRFNESNGQREV
jgi:hypothetical protein